MSQKLIKTHLIIDSLHDMGSLSGPCKRAVVLGTAQVKLLPLLLVLHALQQLIEHVKRALALHRVHHTCLLEEVVVNRAADGDAATMKPRMYYALWCYLLGAGIQTQISIIISKY